MRSMSPSRSLARVLGLVILGLLVSSPLSAQSDSSPVLKPLVEDRASRAWKRMRSAHFTAVGDASERDMQRTLTELEVFRATLLAAFPSMTLDAGGPLTVILFSSRDAIAPFVPRDANGRPEREIIGYQTSNGEATYLVMVVGQNLPSLRDPVSLVVSSLMEDVVARNIPHAPYWVRVGLAELYSVPARSNEERRVLGRANRSSVSWLRNAALLPFDVMTRIGGEDDLDETNPSTFFAQSWALVHYLILSGQRTGQLDAYLEALRRGPRPLRRLRHRSHQQTPWQSSCARTWVVRRSQLCPSIFRVPCSMLARVPNLCSNPKLWPCRPNYC